MYLNATLKGLEDRCAKWKQARAVDRLLGEMKSNLSAFAACSFENLSKLR